MGPLVVNALSLLALVVVALGMFTWWRTNRGEPAIFSGAPLVATHVAGTLYETASGKPVLVVRGEVVASGGAPVGRALVTVELVDGGRVVARATATPGAHPTAEEVHAVDGAAAAERLAAAVAARAAPSDRAGPARFTAVLADLPPGAERLVLRATATPVP
jgi:hypothetical protein